MKNKNEINRHTNIIPQDTDDNESSTSNNDSNEPRRRKLRLDKERLRRWRLKTEWLSFTSNLIVLILTAAIVGHMIESVDLRQLYNSNVLIFVFRVLSILCLVSAILFGNLSVHARLSIYRIDVLLEKSRLEKRAKVKTAEYDRIKEIEEEIHDLKKRSVAKDKRARALYEVEIYSFAAGAIFVVAYNIIVQ